MLIKSIKLLTTSTSSSFIVIICQKSWTVIRISQKLLEDFVETLRRDEVGRSDPNRRLIVVCWQGFVFCLCAPLMFHIKIWKKKFCLSKDESNVTFGVTSLAL